MKKIIIPLILTMMLLAVNVYAFGLPIVISGYVRNEGDISGITVTLRNMRTGGEMLLKTSGSGHFLFDVGNIAFGVRAGDTFEIGVNEHRIFIDDFNWVTYQPYEVEIDLFGRECPKCFECDVCEDCPPPECPDCKVCEDCPEPIVCPEPVICPEPEECPDPDENKAMEILLTAIIAAGVAGGAVSLTLSSKAQHYHRGIRSKHSIFTRHRDSEIRHPIGEIVPLYKKINNKYIYVGSN